MGYIEELRALVGHRRLNLSGCTVILRNERGELLLEQRVFPEGRWCFPGGLMELGESAEDTARREVLEETGLTVGELELLTVSSGPDRLCRAANGDEWYVVDIVYMAKDFHGEARVNDGESVTLGWFAPEDMPAGLVMSHRRVLEEYLRRSGA